MTNILKTTGHFNGYDFSVSYYAEWAEKGQFGINGGRIIRLNIRKDGYSLIKYKLGWKFHPDNPDEPGDVHYPLTDDDKEMYRLILEKFN